MTAASSAFTVSILVLIGFLVSLQFNLAFFRPGFTDGSGRYQMDSTCVDCPYSSQTDDENTHTIEHSNRSDDDDDFTPPLPPYLDHIWSTKKPKIPSNWTYIPPKFTTPPPNNFSPDPTNKIIVHYHMQHNAGTNFYKIANQFTIATRACWQTSKHCMISYNEQVEANNLRNNYQQHGVQYVSYEFLLHPRFPLPFVSASARQGLFFTTILRNPFKRLITAARSDRYTPRSHGAPPENFWQDVEGVSAIYKRENLNVRWLSGAMEGITEDHVNIAKCRLQLFDLVIVDGTYDTAVNEVVCPLNNWQGQEVCNSNNAREKGEYKSNKANPFKETDAHFVGAWIERLRPSFELYDYARILSYLQLKDRGVRDVPELSEVPSYIDTLARYTNITLTYPKHNRVSLENIGRFHPPKDFCDNLKEVWVSNADEVPYFHGIGGLDPE